MSFSTEIVINAVVYCACVLDPILYFVANPDYRAAVRAAWGDMYCNKDPVEVSANDDEKGCSKVKYDSEDLERLLPSGKRCGWVDQEQQQRCKGFQDLD